MSTSADGPSYKASTKKERGSHEQFTPEEKLQMGKRAAEHGVASTIRYFHMLFSDHAVKESSVCTWQKKSKEITKRKSIREEETTMDLKQLPSKKRGRTLF